MEYIALADYQTDDLENEISFMKGDILFVEKSSLEEVGNEGWVVGRHSKTGEVGYIPGTYLRLVQH